MTWNWHLTGDWAVWVFSLAPPPDMSREPLWADWDTVQETRVILRVAKASPPVDTDPFAEETTIEFTPEEGDDE